MIQNKQNNLISFKDFKSLKLNIFPVLMTHFWMSLAAFSMYFIIMIQLWICSEMRINTWALWWIAMESGVISMRAHVYFSRNRSFNQASVPNRWVPILPQWTLCDHIAPTGLQTSVIHFIHVEWASLAVNPQSIW